MLIKNNTKVVMEEISSKLHQTSNSYEVITVVGGNKSSISDKFRNIFFNSRDKPITALVTTGSFTYYSLWFPTLYKKATMNALHHINTSGALQGNCHHSHQSLWAKEQCNFKQHDTDLHKSVMSFWLRNSFTKAYQWNCVQTSIYKCSFSYQIQLFF